MSVLSIQLMSLRAEAILLSPCLIHVYFLFFSVSLNAENVMLNKDLLVE